MSRSPLARLASAALLLASSAALAAPPAAPRRVAVLDFSASWAGECGGGAALDTGRREQCELLRILADQARGGALAVLGPPAFVVMTRENTAQILKDMGGACAEGECEVETARLIGASLVVSGEVSLMEGVWIVSLKAHDVTTAALVATGNVQGRTKLELFGNVRAETERMLRGAAGMRAESPTPASAFALAADAAVDPRAPGEAAESAGAGARRERFYVEARAGTGLAWGNIDGMSGKALGDLLLEARFGVRLNADWSLEAGGGYVNFFKDDLLGGAAFQETKAITFAVGAAWRSPWSRHLSFAGEAGVDRTSHRATVTVLGTTTSETESEWMPHVAVEARADVTVGPLDLGVRTGLRAARSNVLSSGYYATGAAFGDSGVVLVIPVTLAATLRF